MGNGHSSGEWKYNNVERDYLDLCHIVDFVRDGLQCQVGCIIGHSLGSASILKYAAANAILEEKGSEVMCRKFVNLAGHYYTPPVTTPFDEEDMTELKEKGFFYLKHPYEEKRIQKFKVTQEQVDTRTNRDSYGAVKHLGRSDSQIRVLTIHGSKDKMVHIENACKFDREIAHHKLTIVECADHNFNGVKFHDSILVPAISSFVQEAGDSS